jgi:hypothetical protein
MVSLGSIDANQYGVGVPVDTPVMLTYFEGNELKPVKPDYPDYDHLVNHVAVQMDTNEFQLYRTPVVLTLQGDLDDDEEEENDDGEEEMEGDEDEEEYTLDELLAMEDDDDEEFDEDEEDDEDEDEDEDDDNEDDDNNGNMSSFWASSPSGKIDEKYNKIPDISLFRAPSSDTAPAEIPADALVTEEDTKALKKAHRKADRVIQYAADLTLIASFHYKKKNYHLVRLLEPILIIGKRVTDIKGYIHTHWLLLTHLTHSPYLLTLLTHLTHLLHPLLYRYYFTLLDDKETSVVRPIMEELMLKNKNKNKKTNELSMDTAASTRPASRDAATDSGRKTSRRRWANRNKDK